MGARGIPWTISRRLASVSLQLHFFPTQNGRLILEDIGTLGEDLRYTSTNGLEPLGG